MTEWTTGIHDVKTQEVRGCLATALLDTEQADSDSLGAALLRSLVWAFSRAGEAPYVLRFMNPALELWMAYHDLSDEHAAREQLNSILENLEVAGDLLALPEGRWLPGPTREVDLASNELDRLLVGGLPTNVLPPSLRGLISHHGAFRRVSPGSLARTLSIPVESLASWTRSPANLADWTQELLSLDLPPYAAGDEEAAFRIYSGRPCRKGISQSQRWAERAADVAPGRYLAERRRVFGAREYRVVEVAGGRIVRSGALLLPGEARRLQYGVDLQSGNPVNVKMSKDDEGLVIYLFSEIPRPEQRLFAALGRLEVSSDRYYPRVWHFPEESRQVVLSRLHALGVMLVVS